MKRWTRRAPCSATRRTTRPVRYDEITVYDPKTRTAHYSIRSIAGKTVQVNGQIRFVEDPTGVRLSFSGDAQVKIFALGSMLERFLVSEVKTRYGQVEPVLQRFVDGRPACVTYIYIRARR